jgi:hypothetical protein
VMIFPMVAIRLASKGTGERDIDATYE